MNVSEVSTELKKALDEQIRNRQALEKAQEALAPLEIAVKGSDNAVSVLMRQLQGLTEDGTAPKRGRSTGGAKRTYNVTPEGKVQATIKRQTTKALNQGMSQKEATKRGKEAGEALAKKLGL